MNSISTEQYHTKKANEVMDKMLSNDSFSLWLGVEKVSIAPGKCILRMKIRKEMLNGFGIVHGGISFSLADSALAFASNSYGRKAFSIETSISHLAKVSEGETLTAIAEELSLTNKIGIYQVRITNDEQKLIAIFKGTTYRSSEEW